MTVRQRIADLIQPVQTRFEATVTSIRRETRDFGKADYAFWDRASAGKARGLEISGLLLRPLASKTASWVMGESPPTWEVPDHADLQDDLNKWWSVNYSDIIRAYELSVGLGDCGLIVNADMTVSIIPPNEAIPKRNPNDPSQIIGWTFVDKFKDPAQRGQSWVITDEYTRMQRVRTITSPAGRVSKTTYPNLIRRVPAMLISNIRGADEQFGRAEGAAFVTLLQRYGEVIEAAINGNIRQGRPTPVIEKMGTAEQVKKFWEKFGRKEQRTLPDGTVEVVDVLDVDLDKIVTLGGDATLDYKQPGSFTGDTIAILGILYSLIVEHSEIPEFVWGAAVSSTKASTETQFEPFVKWIEKRRGIASKWMIEITQIVLRYLALRKLASVPDFEVTMPGWRHLMSEDGRLTLDTVSWAHGEGIITDELAARLIPVHVPDVAKETTEGKKQWKRRKQFEADLKATNPVGNPGTNPASTNKNGRNDNPQGNPNTNKPSGTPTDAQSRTRGRVPASPVR